MSSASMTTEVNVIGKVIRRSLTIATDGMVVKDPAVPAAKAGALTTRTDNTTGTLTMAAGHGFGTGNRLDVYWLNADGTTGRRYGVAAGTVATNSVPISGGAGDSLPANATAITAMVPQLESFPVTAANMSALLCSAAVPATLVFRSSVPAVVASVLLTGPNGGYVWESTGGATTPFGSDVADVYLSHGDSTGAQPVSAVAMVN